MQSVQVPVSAPTSEPRDLYALKAKYRREWDAHQVIADANARLLHAGKKPSDEQLIYEQLTAEAVRLARDALRRKLDSAGVR